MDMLQMPRPQLIRQKSFFSSAQSFRLKKLHVVAHIRDCVQHVGFLLRRWDPSWCQASLKRCIALRRREGVEY